MGNDTSKGNKSGELSQKEIAVLKANSNLSEQEIQEMYEGFKIECPSGKMNKTQFLKFYKQIVGSDDQGVNLTDNMFAVFDNNHDGSISFSEFVLATAIGSKNDLDSQLELAFAMMDTSGDEHISYDEMVKFLGKALKLGDPADTSSAEDLKMLAKETFDEFGLDKGQKLSKRQFIDGCKKNKDLREMFGS